MQKKKCTSQKKPKKLPIFSVLATVVFCGYMIFCLDQYFAKCVKAYADFECEQIAAESIQQAISKVLETDSNLAENLYAIKDDRDGRAAQIILNAQNMNLARDRIARALSDALDEAVQKQPQVHISALLGSYCFSQKGPMIQLKIYPQHFSRVRLEPSLQSSGINQSNFRMDLSFEVNLSTSIFNYRSNAKSNITVPLVNILVFGATPSYYAG